MRGTGVTGSRVDARLVLKENSTDSVPMMVQQELSLRRALFASLGQGEAWEETQGHGAEVSDGGHHRWEASLVPGLPILGSSSRLSGFPTLRVWTRPLSSLVVK